MSVEPIRTFAAWESTEPQDIKTLTLSRRSLDGETVEQTEWVSREDYDRIKARAEKLGKAGDWMCGLLRFDFVTKEWNAAKEGKPSE